MIIEQFTLYLHINRKKVVLEFFPFSSTSNKQSCQLILIYLRETSTRYSLTRIWYSVYWFYRSGFGVPIFRFPPFCRSWFYYMPFFRDVNKTSHWAAANIISERLFKIFYWVFRYEKGIWYFRNSQCCFKTQLYSCMYIFKCLFMNLAIFRDIVNFLWNMREIFNFVRDSL